MRYYFFYISLDKNKKMRNQKRILSTILFVLLTLFIISCKERENITENNIFEKLEKKKYDKISQNLFQLGVSSYIIDENKIIFESFENFNINGFSGNMSKKSFKLINEKLVFEGYSIGVEDNKLFFESNTEKEFVTDEFDFSKLDNRHRLLFSVFIELFGKNIDKKEYTTYFMDAKSGCSWSNTYYISGWGKTPSAAWADYHHNSSTLNGLPSGGTCRPLGYAHLSTMTVSIYIVDFELYQVDRAFCCN